MFCPKKIPVVRPDAMKDGVFEAPAQAWQLSKDAAAYLRQRCWMGMAGPGFINQFPDANHGAGIFTYMTGSFLG